MVFGLFVFFQMSCDFRFLRINTSVETGTTSMRLENGNVASDLFQVGIGFCFDFIVFLIMSKRAAIFALRINTSVETGNQ